MENDDRAQGRPTPEGKVVDGPSPHLSYAELACWNKSGHAWEGFAPGEMIAEYPVEWREDPLVRLAATFEAVRTELGNFPMRITSAYRTKEYNKLVANSTDSQHSHGKALDIQHPTVNAHDMFDAIRRMYAAGRLPFLGGIGSYDRWVHIDVRDRVGKRLAVWIQNS